jgi:hypothetical protein
LQPGKIKALAGRRAYNRILQKLSVYRAVYGMLIFTVYEIAVDFVGYYKHVMFRADIAHFCQFVKRPHPADGIVRIA